MGSIKLSGNGSHRASPRGPFLHSVLATSECRALTKPQTLEACGLGFRFRGLGFKIQELYGMIWDVQRLCSYSCMEDSRQRLKLQEGAPESISTFRYIMDADSAHCRGLDS